MQAIKKFLLSASVIGAFAVYIFYEKAGASTVIVPTPTTSAEVTDTSMPTSLQALGQYKDGRYTGPVTDAYYGNYQVRAVISGGKLTDVIFLQTPSDRRTSIEINSQASPWLKTEAIQAQSAQVDTISGATQSSRAFRESLAVALDAARN